MFNLILYLVIANQHSSKLKELVRSGSNKYHHDLTSVSIENLAAVFTHNYAQVAHGRNLLLNSGSQQDDRSPNPKLQTDKDLFEYESPQKESILQMDKRLIERIEQLNFDVSFNAHRFKDENERLRKELSRILAENAEMKMRVLNIEGSIKSFSLRASRSGQSDRESIVREERIKSYDKDFNIVDRRILKTATLAVEASPGSSMHNIVANNSFAGEVSKPQSSHIGSARQPPLQDSSSNTPMFNSQHDEKIDERITTGSTLRVQVENSTENQVNNLKALIDFEKNRNAENNEESKSPLEIFDNKSNFYLTSDTRFLEPEEAVGTEEHLHSRLDPSLENFMSSLTNKFEEPGEDRRTNHYLQHDLRTQIEAFFLRNTESVRQVKASSAEISSLCIQAALGKLNRSGKLPSLRTSSVEKSEANYARTLGEPSLKTTEAPNMTLESGSRWQESSVFKGLWHLLSELREKFGYGDNFETDSFVEVLEKLSSFVRGTEGRDVKQGTLRAISPPQIDGHFLRLPETPPIVRDLVGFPSNESTRSSRKASVKDPISETGIPPKMNYPKPNPADPSAVSVLVEAKVDLIDEKKVDLKLAVKVELPASEESPKGPIPTLTQAQAQSEHQPEQLSSMHGESIQSTSMGGVSATVSVAAIQRPVDAIDGGIVYLPDFSTDRERRNQNQQQQNIICQDQKQRLRRDRDRDSPPPSPRQLRTQNEVVQSQPLDEPAAVPVPSGFVELGNDIDLPEISIRNAPLPAKVKNSLFNRSKLLDDKDKSKSKDKDKDKEAVRGTTRHVEFPSRGESSGPSKLQILELIHKPSNKNSHSSNVHSESALAFFEINGKEVQTDGGRVSFEGGFNDSIIIDDSEVQSPMASPSVSRGTASSRNRRRLLQDLSTQTDTEHNIAQVQTDDFTEANGERPESVRVTPRSQEVSSFVYHFESVNKEEIMNELTAAMDKRIDELDSRVQADMRLMEREVRAALQEQASALSSLQSEWQSHLAELKESQKDGDNAVLQTAMQKIAVVQDCIEYRVRAVQSPWLLVLENAQVKVEKAEAMSLQALELVQRLSRRNSNPNPMADAPKKA